LILFIAGCERATLPVAAGMGPSPTLPSGPAVDVLTGFLDGSGNARGRPAGVAVDKAGALLVADDVGDTIWRVTR
jgi:glucose/arabinose dehydrogenase